MKLSALIQNDNDSTVNIENGVTTASEGVFNFSNVIIRGDQNLLFKINL